jgi:hypothetical protein
MITIHVSPDDLVNMRFAYRPLMEIPLSCRVLRNPDFQNPHRRWIEEARQTLHGHQFPYLGALVPARGYIPDFITQPPMFNRTDIEADFLDILATPDDIIRKDILTLIEEDGDSDMRRYFLAHPREATHCLIEEMREYWRLTLEHHWSRMVSRLEGDVLYRARLLALEGPGPVFQDLHPTISYQPGEIHIQKICSCLHDDHSMQLNGEGVQLVPTIFRGCGRMFLVDPDWHPMLVFGVRGTGLWLDKPITQGAGFAGCYHTLHHR